MIRWQRGLPAIERLVAEGSLQVVTGAQANGGPWLDKANKTIETAAQVRAIDPASACTLAYDATRFACMAILAQQGLRPTTQGGHLALENAVRAQFGDGFKPFRDLRIRRNELEYPEYADELVEPDEAHHAVEAGRGIIAASAQIVPRLRIIDIASRT